MKKVNFIFGALLLVAVLAIGVTNKRIDKIESKLNENETIEESEETVKTEITLQGEYATYVQAKFPFKGEYCVETSGSITFYSDIECTKEIIDSKFLSIQYDLIFIENRKIYCYLLDNGEICYSLGDKYPDLVPESYYNTYIKTE